MSRRRHVDTRCRLRFAIDLREWTSLDAYCAINDATESAPKPLNQPAHVLEKPAAAGEDGEARWSGTPNWYLWAGGHFSIGRSEGVLPSHAHHAIQIVITVEGTAGSAASAATRVSAASCAPRQSRAPWPTFETDYGRITSLFNRGMAAKQRGTDMSRAAAHPVSPAAPPRWWRCRSSSSASSP